MTSPAPSQPSWWIGLHFALILCSAVIVLYPPVRHVQAFVLPFSLVLVPAYVIAQIWQLKAEGTGNLTLGQLYRQAKAGRRLSTSGLETAAAIALVMAVMSLR